MYNRDDPFRTQPDRDHAKLTAAAYQQIMIERVKAGWDLMETTGDIMQRALLEERDRMDYMTYTYFSNLIIDRDCIAVHIPPRKSILQRLFHAFGRGRGG